MGHLLAQVRFERGNGISEDVVVNTFHFQTVGATVSQLEAEDVAQRLVDFFQLGGISIQTYMSTLLSTLPNGASIRIYDQADLKPRAPRFIRRFTLAPSTTGAASLPAEVACCLSFSAGPGAGPIARRRGRVYIGPLSTSSMEFQTGSAEGLNGDQRPATNFLISLRQAGVALASRPAGSLGPFWAVYSPTDQALRQVVEVSTDDAFDTQRRRGSDPTSRVRAFITG